MKEHRKKSHYSYLFIITTEVIEVITLHMPELAVHKLFLISLQMRA